MTDKEFINEFKNITLANICRKLNVNYYNIMSGRAGYETTKKVADEIEKQIKLLLENKKA